MGSWPVLFSMNKERLKSELKKHEGVVLHAYEDHLGFLTIGVGRLIDERRGGGLSEDEATYLLGNDIDRVISSLETKFPRLNQYPERIQEALCQMAFQLGITGLMQFKNMIAALEEGDYWGAADAALNSRWAQQTPNRANEIAGMIRGE